MEVQAAIGAGVGAKLLCSGLFVSGRAQDDVVRNDLLPLSPVLRMLSFDVDRARGSVTASAGPIRRTAAFRTGLGCTLDAKPANGAPAPAPARPARPAAPAIAMPSGAMASALATAMADPSGDLRSRAILVMHRGRIVAERYADGVSPSMPLLGWSMSKSVTAAVAGLLVMDGKLSPDAPLAAAEWPAGDPRAAITLRQLLRMSSGLRFVEDYSIGNDSTWMLYLAPDMAGYAAALPLDHAPGTHWSYSSGSTNIAARAIVAALGGPAGARAYMRDRLFAPLGMTSAVFEEDAVGTPVGSSYVYATARDWGRFGQLFLDRGRAANQTILPPEWVDFVRTPAPASTRGDYGGSFWLNGRAERGEGRRYPSLPADAFFVLGHNGQSIGIFPSHDAVIVRLGWTTGDAKFDLDGNYGRILAALPSRKR